MRPFLLTLVTLAGVACVACGTEHPVAPQAAPPVAPLVPAPPRAPANVDWAALERLFNDPLYRSLPALLSDQAAAEPLHADVRELLRVIEDRDAEGLLRSLERLSGDRHAYAERAGFMAGESVVLAAMTIFQLRAHAFIGREALDGLLVVEGRSG